MEIDIKAQEKEMEGKGKILHIERRDSSKITEKKKEGEEMWKESEHGERKNK